MESVGKTRGAGVTLRAILIALALILLDNYWITVIEVRWYALDGTCLPIYITPVFLLFLLALANLGVRKLRPALGLQRGELLIVYMMMAMGAALASHDLIQNLFGAIGHANYAANETNNYAKLFYRYLPNDLLITNKAVLNGFYRGNTDPWVWGILRYWIVPLALWGGLVMVMISMMMCLNILIRKQWTENEKLVFPLVQLPLEMTSDHSAKRFYANKLMWGGFGIAFAIGLINGLHALYPNMPVIEGVKAYNLGQFMTSSPWNAMARGGNGFAPAAYPFAIGLAYFIPLDLSFSCWFFYIARKLVQVFGAAIGLNVAGNADFPYYESQSSGAWLALAAIIVIGSLPYMRGVWRQAWGKGIPDADPAEARLYRRAFSGLGLGALFLLAFCHWMGMAAWAAVVFFGIYFLLAIAMTRVRAELGTPHEIYFVNPQQIMVSVLGYNVLGPANLTLISVLYWFNRCYRSHPMPNQLEGLKMAEGTSIKLRPLIFALMLAAFAGLITTYYANLNVTYEAGAQAKCMGFKWWVGAESFNRLSTWLTDKPAPDTLRITYMAVGAAVVIALKGFRGAFVSWPFHPAGYALAISYAMDYFWFAFFVSWLAKLLIIRYGGMRLHNTFVPFFLGLILGDFCIGSIWAIIGPIIHTQTYKVFI